MNNLIPQLRELTRFSFGTIFNWNALSGLQKKVIGIALSIILAISACCIYFVCWRRKKDVEVINNDKNDDKPQKSVQGKAKNIAKKELSTTPEINNDKLSPLITPKVKQNDPPTSLPNHVNPKTFPPSQVNPIDKITHFSSYDLDNVEYALNVYKKFKNSPQDSLKKACEDYLQSFHKYPSDCFVKAFNLIKDEPYILSLCVDQGSANQHIINHHLTRLEIIQFPENLLMLVLMILEKNKNNPSCVLGSFFDYCPEKELKILTQNIIAKTKDPCQNILSLLKPIEKGIFPERMKTILELALPSFQTKKQLQALWVSGISCPLFFPLLSKKQTETLIDVWKENPDYIYQLGWYFIDVEPSLELVQLCHEKKVNIAELINISKDKAFQVKLCAYYVIILLNNPSASNVDNVSTIIKDRLAFTHKDAEIFAKIVAENCSADHASILMDIFKDQKGIGRAQTFAQTFLLTLLKSKSPDNEKIKNAFSVYWKAWKIFDQSEPRCSWLILPEIKSEEILKIICEEVPFTQMVEIKEHLKKPHFFNDFGTPREYRISLPQAVVDKVLDTELFAIKTS